MSIDESEFSYEDRILNNILKAYFSLARFLNF